MNIPQYIEILNNRYQSGISREHSYRADLENLIRSLVPEINVTNEPADVTDCGNPDYVLTKGKIPVGYIEAKDIGKDLASKIYNEQFTRYREALDNLIITDYLWFRFYDHSELVHEIRIGEIQDGKVIPAPENFQKFENLIINFSGFIGQTIRSPKKLAIMMANKARLLQNILENAVTSDEATQENTSLKGQFETFKEILIHDLTPKGFADIYAQTLAYGMFAARLHDSTLEDFSRQEAAELIPKSNPFLRKLFGYVAGPDIDDRIVMVVDNLADVFRATNIEKLLKNFGKNTQTQDAIIHFYETFLAEYDPKLRKSRGVWYTPEPVVKFIVRAVDDILKSEFSLAQGLADTSKSKIKVNTDVADKRSATGYKQVEKEVHKVQILDPATGTGTFLAEVIRFIYSEKFEKMQGAWSGYVEEHLIPRINGFELLMASYAMAHLKLDMLLRETGYKANGSTQRLNVYLTNSLEAHHNDTGTLFSNWLSTEANEANHIKRDTPVMCVIGNPPYSGESANKGKWIMDLMEDYKKEPGGKVKLKERNPKWINDDYVKFMRYGQHYVEKNGEGILAFINPHGFLDNPTFRGMRWNLLKTYDKIYTIDLHGNSKKKETTPEGGKDDNVFDIQQGVSINILIKTGLKSSNELGQVFHYDAYGRRDEKYQFLTDNDLQKIPFVKLPNIAPNYFMVQKDFEAQEQYLEGFLITELFPTNSVGVVSSRDNFVIANEVVQLKDRLKLFYNLSRSEIIATFNLKEKKHWKIEEVKSKSKEFNSNFIEKISYRPFDIKNIYYDTEFIERDRFEVMKNFVGKKNIGLNWIRPMSSKYEFDIFISKFIADQCSAGNKSAGAGISYLAPLYLYPSSTDQTKIDDSTDRKPNLNKKIVDKIAKKLNYVFFKDHEIVANVREEYDGYFNPLSLLDYIYAVLHSPTYRETYKEFLKIDFPRVPYPKDAETFNQLVQLGGELRAIHLLESPLLEEFITSYPKDGDNVIHRKITMTSPGYESDGESKTGKVWINDEQYFEGVPEVAWEFYIGGYQPAQKWLKDRKGRKLSYEDIQHYQKIIVALTETNRLMLEIDEIDFIS